MRHPLPEAALDGRLCIVGISGSGKSTTAKGGVERLLAQGRRVCVVDLLDGWWGLRLKRDGKTPAFPVAIFGGQHGDLPLTEHAGALIGQAVAQSEGSSIVSLSELDGDAARRRFALAFFNALHNGNRAPLHLVIDEADFYAPQNPPKGGGAHGLYGEGPAPLLLNRVKEIAARGRMRGFRCWPITQRPAKLHKDVLSQSDTLIAMQLTSSQDRAAIEGWIGDQGDKDAGKAILASLPSLKLGQGVLWSPRIGVLDTVHFPLPATYDSSRTPEYGEEVANVELKAIDLGALREKMGKVEAEAKANDPRTLRQRIVELEKQLRAGGESRSLNQAESQASHDMGFRAGRDAAGAAARDLYEGRIRAFRMALEPALQNLVAPVPAPSMQPTANQAQNYPTPKAAPASVSAAPRPSPQPARHNMPVNGSGELVRGERIILTVLAQYAPAALDKARLGAIAGFASKGGSFRTYVGRLKTIGYVDRDALRITQAGLDALGSFEPMPTGRALLEHWCARLVKGEREILQAVARQGGEATRDQVGDATGFEPSGGSFRTYVGKLKTLGLLTGSNPLQLHEDLL